MKKKKTFYGVTSKFYDNDVIEASITHHLKSHKKPRNEEKTTAECDIYLEWFTSRKEALAVVDCYTN